MIFKNSKLFANELDQNDPLQELVLYLEPLDYLLVLSFFPLGKSGVARPPSFLEFIGYQY